MSLQQRLTDWLQEEWHTKPALLLRPLEILFQTAVFLRRQAYRRGWKPSHHPGVPVIVVGNLSVGGTGKTPLTIWLADFLLARGWRPGIVSRGYGGQAEKTATRPLMVTAESDPNLAGDEPVLIARHTGCPVCVFPRRAEAAQALLAGGDCDILLADDGLQHYALARDIEIAVVDAERGFGNGHLLPAGPLRESPQRLDTVDLVVYAGTAPAGAYSMTLEGGEAVSLCNEDLRIPLENFADLPLHALAGIGHPQRFFQHLRGYGLEPDLHEFPDHHLYLPQDLAFADGASVLMTEKDAVKCRAFAAPHLWYVPVQARLPEAFGEKLLSLLKAKCNGQKTA